MGMFFPVFFVLPILRTIHIHTALLHSQLPLLVVCLVLPMLLNLVF